MRYKRGKVIAITLLCISLALCLSGFSLLLGLSGFITRANEDDSVFDPSYVPTFDDLYTRVPFTATDTGETVIGQNNGLTTMFALRDESYRQGSIYDLLNGSAKRGFSTMTGYRARNPYPLFSNADMQTIVGGGKVDAPVIMLDPSSQDNVVVFELLNLTNPPDPDSFVMKHNGDDLTKVVLPPNTAADNIYGGVPVNPVEGVQYYKEGAVALNELGATTMRGMFSAEGYYEFQFEIMITGADDLPKPVTLSFAFYIVHKANYANFPRFPIASRSVGLSEIYNYSYGGSYPTVNYRPDYFKVDVSSVAAFDHDDEQGTFKFYNIGEYQMTSTLMYFCKYTGEWLTVTRYRPYTSTLYILGYQAYFGGWHSDEQFRGPLPFFDADDSTNSSDISYWVKANSSNLPTVTNNADVSQTLQYSQALVRLLDAQAESVDKLVPVRTNFPPVKFVGNVDYAVGPDASGAEAILATMAFHGVGDFAGTTKIWHHSTLDVGKPFTTAGEYLVTIYFRVNSVLCQQTFYFEITNSVDIKFDTGSEVLTLDELVRNKLYQNQNVTILYDGATALGPYEVPPTLKLERAELGTTNYREIAFNTNSSFKFNLEEGHYRLHVVYGAYAQAVSVAEIVVDHHDAGVITATANAPQMPNLPTNTAVFGDGRVTLNWGEKLSGVGYKRALVEFYKIDTRPGASDPNADRNYKKYNVNNPNPKLFTTATIMPSVTSTNIYTPTKTETGWMLDDEFSAQGAGLYKIIIEDDIGNTTNFILIIDNTKPTFTQSVNSVNDFVNVTDFPGCLGKPGEPGYQEDVPVQVGFGNHKLVGTTNNTIFNGDEFKALVERGVLVQEPKNNVPVFALSVPLAQVEVSVDGGVYQPLTAAELRRGYAALNTESTFYFRVTDILGNISEYYIMLTHDNCQGLVLAESTAQTFDSRGFLHYEPTANTSLVTVKGGMTNRRNVTFSFDQKAVNATYRVKKIDLEFYPLTFDQASPNYPFAAHTENYLTIQGGETAIYVDNSSQMTELRDPAGSYRLALYNQGEATRRGLYILTREYEAGSTTNDPQIRKYWFIVDDTGMLYYDADKYQTDLQVTFGTKVALAPNFDENKNNISSNLPADILGFPSKYNQTTVFRGLDFPCLIPRFSVINNGLTTLLGEGTIQKRIGDNQTGDINYRLVVADNARNLSVTVGNGSATEIIPDGKLTSANYGVLTLLLDTGYGTKATIIKNDATISTLDMQYRDGTYTYVIDPRDLHDLKFQFANDPKGFYADVDVAATSSSWVATGLPEPVDIDYEIVPPAPGTSSTHYVYDLQNPYLTYNWTALGDGDALTVSVITVDGDRTVYTILFDTAAPTYNLARIKNQDNLACDLATVPQDYIYGLTTDFKFERDAGNPYLDTRTISYREVSANGEGETSAVTFRVDSGRTFASIVGLRYNEVKYYQITEQDYAGHVVTYTVQLQGDAYDGDITFVGAVSPAGDNLVLGIEMQVRNTSVDQFWADNRSFKFVCGDEYYFALGGDATWYLNGTAGNGPKNKDFLISVLNGWINAAADRGEKCTYTLYDRIGAIETFEFYNIREDDAQIALEAFTEGGSSVYLETTNYTALSGLLTDPVIADRFKIRVQDATDPNKITDIVNVNFSMPMTFLHNFNIQPDKELIITVTDPFGRQTVTEYHGQKKGGLNFIAYGNTVDRDGITYVGDSRGVELQFMRSVYYVNVYDANGNQLSNIPTVIIGDITTCYFRPTSQYDISQYRIEAIGRLSGAVLFEKTFAFDTRLPSVSWTNASDQPVDLNATFVGTINMQVITNETIKFGFSISYERTYNGMTERVTLRPNTESFQFDKVGRYVVTLRSEIWATSVYEFEIADINDALVNVYDDGVLLQPSDVLFKFYNNDTDEYEYIKNYMFTNNGLVGEDYAANGLNVVPSSSTNRVLVGQNGKRYYYLDNVQNALIWCLAVPTLNAAGETVYTSKVYFATTGITPNEISTTNAGVSLVVNNVVLNRLHDVYAIHNDIGRKGLTIRLSPGNYLDDNGIPYNQYAGNSLVVDCYRNGELIKTLAYNEELLIGEFDSGYYEFTIRDLVGNTLKFGNGDNEVDKYTLVNLSKPMVLINGTNPVNGMIYNDTVEFKVVSLADELLQAHYGEEYFDQYFYVSDMVVYRDGVELPEYTKKDVAHKYPQSTYVWTTKGNYRVELKYIIGDHVYAEGQYAFQIIPSTTALEEVSLNVYADIDIVSVKRNNYLAQGYGNIMAGDKLSFRADSNPGRYEITMRSTDPINGQRLQVVTFSIGYKSSLSSFFTLNTTSGGKTTGTVALTYRTTMLYLFGGDITIEMYRDQVLVDTKTINASTITNLDINTTDSLTASEAGLYSVRAYDAEGDLIYGDSWTIEKAASPMGAIITAIVAGIAGIGLIVFLRIRRKMAVK